MTPDLEPDDTATLTAFQRDILTAIGAHYADVGALGYQIFWKVRDYPEDLSGADELPSHSDKDVIDATLKVLSIGGQVEDYTLGMREGARHVARELGVASPAFWDDENLGPAGEEEFSEKYSTDDRGESDV